VFDVEARVSTHEGPQWFTVMCPGVVQQSDHRATKVPEQVAQKCANLLLPDILLVEVVVEAEVMSSGTHGNAGDHGDFIPPIAVTMNRRVAPRRPGFDHVGDQQEAGFVGEDEVGTQPRSVFFTRGQSFRFHCSMASSLRSTARVSGFW